VPVDDEDEIVEEKPAVSKGVKSDDLPKVTKEYIRRKSAKYVEAMVNQRLAEMNLGRAAPSSYGDVSAIARDRLGKKMSEAAYSSLFPHG
jgi:hypothetical protein